MTSTNSGQITSLHLCVGHREPMKDVDSANVIAKFGMEGDRHATTEGIRTQRQILLMDEATIEAFGLFVTDVRENITLAGLELHSLERGSQVSLGDDVVLKITGHCAPCDRMEELRPGLQQELEGHRGMLATVLQGGTIKVGDSIRVREQAATT